MAKSASLDVRFEFLAELMRMCDRVSLVPTVDPAGFSRS